jgi:hypothetical protein
MNYMYVCVCVYTYIILFDTYNYNIEHVSVHLRIKIFEEFFFFLRQGLTVAQAGLELVSPLPSLQVLGLQACTTIPASW